MRSSLLTLVVLGCLSGAAQGQQPDPAAAPNLKTVSQKVGYGVGLRIGGDMKQRGADFDLEAVIQGIRDAMGGVKQRLTKEEIQQAFQVYEQQQAAKLKKAGADFLAANAKLPGVVTRRSGLQFKVLKAGTGATPKSTDTVTVHYKGTLLNGTEFDSSYKRGEPAKFPVTGVIAGWIEAIQLMKVGGHWRLFIPANLAYKDRAQSGIPANSALIFEVELLATQPSR